MKRGMKELTGRGKDEAVEAPAMRVLGVDVVEACAQRGSPLPDCARLLFPMVAHEALLGKRILFLPLGKGAKPRKGALSAADATFFVEAMGGRIEMALAPPAPAEGGGAGGSGGAVTLVGGGWDVVVAADVGAPGCGELLAALADSEGGGEGAPPRVVEGGWLRACWETRATADPAGHGVRPLQDVVISCTGQMHRDKERLRRWAALAGAQWQHDMDPSCSVLIAACASSDKITFARRLSIPIVSDAWLRACLAAAGQCDPAEFAVRGIAEAAPGEIHSQIEVQAHERAKDLQRALESDSPPARRVPPPATSRAHTRPGWRGGGRALLRAGSGAPAPRTDRVPPGLSAAHPDPDTSPVAARAAGGAAHGAEGAEVRAGAGWAGGGGEGDAYDARLTPAKGCLKKQRGALSSRVLEIRRAVKRTLRWADEVEGGGGLEDVEPTARGAEEDAGEGTEQAAGEGAASAGQETRWGKLPLSRERESEEEERSPAVVLFRDAEAGAEGDETGAGAECGTEQAAERAAEHGEAGEMAREVQGSPARVLWVETAAAVETEMAQRAAENSTPPTARKRSMAPMATLAGGSGGCVASPPPAPALAEAAEADEPTGAALSTPPGASGPRGEQGGGKRGWGEGEVTPACSPASSCTTTSPASVTDPAAADPAQRLAKRVRAAAAPDGALAVRPLSRLKGVRGLKGVGARAAAGARALPATAIGDLLDPYPVRRPGGA
jgi:hypothetical protein